MALTLCLKFDLGGLVGHVDAGAVDVELPAVIHAAQAGFFVAAEEQADAPRWGQLFWRNPTLPLVSRKATRSSPRMRQRIGSLSGWGNSEDSRAGSQKRRNSSPIGVPGPTRVRSSLSALLSIFGVTPPCT